MHFSVNVLKFNSCWNCSLRDGNSKRKYSLGFVLRIKWFQKDGKLRGKVYYYEPWMKLIVAMLPFGKYFQEDEETQMIGNNEVNEKVYW